MSCLVLRFSAPAQSWGGQATSRWRPTEQLPTRSGIEGLLRGALGMRRGQDRPELAELDVVCRVERAGRIEEDYHTVTPAPEDVVALRERRIVTHERGRKPRADFVVPRADGFAWEVKGKVTSMVTRRTYLADAEFMVAIGHGDRSVVDELASASHRPAFPVFLGRAAHPATFPFHLGVHRGGSISALSSIPSCAAGKLPLYEIGAGGPKRVGEATPQVVPGFAAWLQAVSAHA